MKISDEAVLLRGAVVSGDVTLEAGVSVWYNSVLRGDLAPIVIGKNSNVQENAVLHIDYDKPCILGEGVTVGHGAILHGCTVGDNTVVGMGAILLSGAQVGRDCIIGAGSLVTGKTVVPDGMLVLGSPAPDPGGDRPQPGKCQRLCHPGPKGKGGSCPFWITAAASW